MRGWSEKVWSEKRHKYILMSGTEILEGMEPTLQLATDTLTLYV